MTIKPHSTVSLHLSGVPIPGGSLSSLLETMAGEGIRHRAPGLGEGVTPGIRPGLSGVTGVTGKSQWDSIYNSTINDGKYLSIINHI